MNHWLKKLKEAKAYLGLCKAAIWTGVRYVGIKPISMSLKWHFQDVTHIQEIHIIGKDGEVLLLPIGSGSTTVDITVPAGGTVDVKFNGIAVNGYPIELLISPDE